MNFFRKIKKLQSVLGPGLITGAADDDPAGIATYSQTGAQAGFGLLWLALFTYPLMSIVQEMCARIGLVTGRGLSYNIKAHYKKWILYPTISLLFFANTFNIAADLRAMADSVRLIYPGANVLFLVFFFTCFSSITQIFVPYKKYVKFLKFLVLFLFCYVVTAFISHVNWVLVFQGLIVPNFNWTKDGLLLISAIVGTTISPYLFFWQSSEEIEDEIMKGKSTLQSSVGTNRNELFSMRADVWFGMFISNLIMFFIIVVCGSVLFTNGITNISTSAEAAQALKPLAGNFAYFLFAFGIIGTGLLAIPTLAGSNAYAAAETLGKPEGLYKKWFQAKTFYATILFSMFIAYVMNFINIDPIKMLIYSAILNAIVAPVMIYFIYKISANEKIMGQWKNKNLTNFFAILILILMSAISLSSIYFLFF